MSLSRPIYNLLGIYFEQLFNNPVRTKSITSCALAVFANYTSQKISGVKKINRDNLVAYGLFGLLLGGTVPHYFYVAIGRLLQSEIKFRKFMFFLIERFIYEPLNQLLSLYFLSRFEGHEHKDAIANLQKLYWPLLEANWKYLSLAVFLNIYYVPPVLRVLISNIIGFTWIVFVATKRRKAQMETKSSSSSTSSTSAVS